MTRLLRTVAAGLVLSPCFLAWQVSPVEPGQFDQPGIENRSCTRAEYQHLTEHEGRIYLCRYLPDPRTFAWQPPAPAYVQPAYVPPTPDSQR